MVIDEILKDIEHRETRFVSPPKNKSYAVWSVSYDRRGTDNFNAVNEEDYTIELYEYSPDKETEAKIEAQFDLLAIPYTKQERYFIQSEQLYQIIYEFTLTRKRG